MEETQLKEYMVILWNDNVGEEEGTSPHKIDEFVTLKEAVLFMVRHGALYGHQEIVKKVNWLPGQEQPVVKPVTPARVTPLTPEEQELANKPNPQGPPPEQPVEIGADGQINKGQTRILSVSERLKGMMLPGMAQTVDDPE